MKERDYWLGFAVCSGIGPGRFQKLLSHFGSAKNAWAASSDHLLKSGIGESMVATFFRFPAAFFIC